MITNHIILTVLSLTLTSACLVPVSSQATRFKEEKVGTLPKWYLDALQARENLRGYRKPNSWYSYSSDKKKVVIITKKKDDSFEMDLMEESKERRRLISSRKGFSVPSWSADDSKIAFYSITEVNEDFMLGDIYVMDVKSLRVNVVKRDLAQGADPAWSPGNSMLMFSDFGDVYVADLIKGDVTRVVSRGGYANGAPGFPQRYQDFVWSPDGAEVIYEYVRDYLKMGRGEHYSIGMSEFRKDSASASEVIGRLGSCLGFAHLALPIWRDLCA